MKLLAVLIGLAIAALGLVGLVQPEVLVSIGHRSATPAGLYVVALIRVLVGLVLLGVASASRAPLGLRVLGTLILFVGLATPLFGPARAQAYLAWWERHGTWVPRLSALGAIVIGSAIVYALSDSRRTAIPRSREARRHPAPPSPAR